MKPCLPLVDLYYPEFVGAALNVNAGWLLHQGWKLIRPFLSEQIQRSVHIVDEKGAAIAVRTLADVTTLPRACYGTTDEMDEFGRQWLRFERSAVPAELFTGDYALRDDGSVFPGKLGPYLRAAVERSMREASTGRMT